MSKEKTAQGFILRCDDWSFFIEDYDAEEVTAMLVASIEYFRSGVVTDFSDRGMRQFFRQIVRCVAYDQKAYAEKCLRNAYNRYRGICKTRNENPLSLEAWSEARRRSLTTGTNIEPESEDNLEEYYESEFESEYREKKEKSIEGERRGGAFTKEPFVPLSAEEFNAERERRINKLDMYTTRKAMRQ